MTGGEYATRGHLDAYDAATGKRKWRFYTIPGPGEPGNETWKGESWKTGGGPTWLTGSFDPALWRLGRLPGDPEAAAILLLAGPADRDAWEVAYLGLTPPARGRGLGRAALAHALDLARPNVSRLELAVDARNHPANRLYLTGASQLLAFPPEPPTALGRANSSR